MSQRPRHTVVIGAGFSGISAAVALVTVVRQDGMHVVLVTYRRLDWLGHERDTPLDQVVTEMAERRIGSALITHHDKLVGIFTVTDACRVLAEILRSQSTEPGSPDAA